MPDLQLTRRAFLRAAAGSSAALGLMACGPAVTPPGPAPAPTPASTAAPKPAGADAPKPAATEAPKPATSEASKPATTAAAKPGTSEAPKPATAEVPRRGGELTMVVSAEPPSFDGHKETTFAVIHPVSPHYSLLLKFDPENYPKIMGDLAESWTVAADNLTYTFKLRDGVKFHDGSPLSSRDVKVSYDRIVAPPEGVTSARRQSYGAIESIETPDARTVVFNLK
jgi:ABC-type transport system substrate-binding protein